MSTIKKVVLAGATGSLGAPTLDALLAAGFEVTVFTRSSSDHKFPIQAKVVKVDYSDVDALTEALRGQDALISTITTAAVAVQKPLIDAAIKASVKRIIPSEFGSDNLNSKTRKFPVYAQKVEVQEYLKDKIKSGNTSSYTFVINNAFLDWGLSRGFLLDLKGHKAELYDGGDRPFSSTTLPTIAKGIVGVLHHLEETANRAVYIQDTVTSQNKLLKIAQGLAPNEKWEVTQIDTEALEKQAYADLAKPDAQPFPAILNFLKRAIFADGYGGHFKSLDNELLGIQELDEEQLVALVKSSA